MNRLSSTGLATAFFRLFILDALAEGPARPAALLARIASERLPFASGAFGRALQSLLEGGHLQPAAHGAVALTALGAAERVGERERWAAVLPTVARMIDELERPAPRGGGAGARDPRLGESPFTSVGSSPAAAASHRPLSESPFAPAASQPAASVVAATVPPKPIARVADAYLDRVLVASVRERVADARDGGRPFAIALGVIDLEHSAESTRRAMLHRAIRATLGGASMLFGGDASAFRYGDAGVAVIAPLHGDPDRGAHVTLLVRARLEELMRTMTATVRGFAGARWRVRAGGATWSMSVATSSELLAIAEEALAADPDQLPAAS